MSFLPNALSCQKLRTTNSQTVSSRKVIQLGQQERKKCQRWRRLNGLQMAVNKRSFYEGRDYGFLILRDATLTNIAWYYWLTLCDISITDNSVQMFLSWWIACFTRWIVLHGGMQLQPLEFLVSDLWQCVQAPPTGDRRNRNFQAELRRTTFGVLWWRNSGGDKKYSVM